MIAVAQDTLNTPHDGNRFGHWILTFSTAMRYPDKHAAFEKRATRPFLQP